MKKMTSSSRRGDVRNIAWGLDDEEESVGKGRSEWRLSTWLHSPRERPLNKLTEQKSAKKTKKGTAGKRGGTKSKKIPKVVPVR